MILDDVKAKETFNNEKFCRGKHYNRNKIYLNQNLCSLDGQNVEDNCNLFVLFEQRGKALLSICQDFFNDVQFTYEKFISLCNEVRREPYNYVVIDIYIYIYIYIYINVYIYIYIYIYISKNNNSILKNNWVLKILQDKTILYSYIIVREQTKSIFITIPITISIFC